MVLKRKLWLILIMAFLGGGIAGAFSKFVLIPQYNSSAMLYILSKETTLTSLADLQIGSQLTKDYTVIVTSRPVLEEVISRLNLDITYKELREKNNHRQSERYPNPYADGSGSGSHAGKADRGSGGCHGL